MRRAAPSKMGQGPGHKRWRVCRTWEARPPAAALWLFTSYPMAWIETLCATLFALIFAITYIRLFGDDE
jgi:hypothetical protein